jgi:ABC-2 type transport system ATP-binding protein
MVGAVLESGDFDPGRSGRNHLRALALATGIAYERVEELLSLVELQAAADRPVRTYSLGMRQRLGLGTALLGDPDLLLLDEPANGLDPAGVHWLRGFLRQFAASGRTVLISSHVLAEVAQTVDAVIIVSHGGLAATVAIDQLDNGARSLEDLYLALTADGAV